ncbi:MAG: Na(+)-translocating NADH-quinone reductase subunit B [Chlamydiales bacterium]|nr:Na(+)-translocating NADH-quinone reductase subunit B [Chlamydiales bacterium]MCH9619982.1 Na(+)-translocating NADH-quinone reductase subunit B [Chlamydiales bacterium]MCH9622591.1 Na(+)-translocating NADH-quinone reductase subunit B [Chlamydiales bacterium]
MLRRFLDFQLSFFEKGKPLSPLRPLVSALDTFCYEPAINVRRRPFVRDAVDVKRWMVLVIFALLPTVLMAMWNTGVQQFVYTSGDLDTMQAYLDASKTLSGYFTYTFSHFGKIFSLGAFAFLPILIVSYGVGILCEGIIACIRGHEINEGFLVTGMLYPLVLPPTVPLWIVACGVIFGVVVGKEIFGGTGMNILNPALTARAFLFFTFPGNMTGDIWVGTNSQAVSKSLATINGAAKLTEVDGYSQASALQGLNACITDIKRVHVDAIATKFLGDKVSTFDVIQKHFLQWSQGHSIEGDVGSLSWDQMRAFVTSPLQEGGLGLLPGNFISAANYGETLYGYDKFSDGNLFFGNIPGSMGETSTLACLLGAFLLILFGIGAWRTMLSFGLGVFVTATAFKLFSSLGIDGGAWNSAKFVLPAYRHFMMGGIAFGLVYMATDPVSSPGMNLSKWIYGFMIGMITILIRVINPAFPEGVMLAILFANVFAPLFDYYVVRHYRRRYTIGKA